MLNKRYLFIGVALGITTLLNSCDHHTKTTTTVINRELLGSWTNDSNCFVQFGQDHGKLVLTNFVNQQKPVVFTPLKLTFYKESIFSKFKSDDHDIKFSGMLTEGLVVINDYCKGTLHKVD